MKADPKSREDWAALMQVLGVKGIHVAERDTQVSADPKPLGVFVNTWSVDGLLSEGYQPAELGWGTHEKKLPPHGHAFDHGPGYAIWIDRPGADTRVRSWCPGVGPQFGYVITHNEALSIPDYYTVWEARSRRLPPDLPLRLPPQQRRHPVDARDERCGQTPAGTAYPDGG